jgi:hypothetical protein
MTFDILSPPNSLKIEEKVGIISFIISMLITLDYTISVLIIFTSFFGTSIIIHFLYPKKEKKGEKNGKNK